MQVPGLRCWLNITVSLLMAIFFISTSVFQIGHSASLRKADQQRQVQLSPLKGAATQVAVHYSQAENSSTSFKLKKSQKAIVEPIQLLEKVRSSLLIAFTSPSACISSPIRSRVFEILTFPHYFLRIGTLLI